jgi:hypothetical protein
MSRHHVPGSGPGPGMPGRTRMTDHEFGEILRRAMRAEVDAAEPAGDGLQRIRKRLEQPRARLLVTLWLTELATFVRLAAIQLEPAALRAREAGAAAWAAVAAWVRDHLATDAGAQAAPARRPRHGAAHRSQPPGRLARLLDPTISWLRPALAVATAVIIVVAGVFALAQLPQNITGVGLLTGGSPAPTAHRSTGTASSPGVAPGLTPPSPVMIPSPRPGRSRPAASPAPSCTPAGSPTPSASGAGPGSPSASPSASTAAPTSTPSATPSPAGSTAAALASPSPSASGSGHMLMGPASNCYNTSGAKSTPTASSGSYGGSASGTASTSAASGSSAMP